MKLLRRLRAAAYDAFVLAVVFGVPIFAGWGLLVLIDRLWKLWGWS